MPEIIDLSHTLFHGMDVFPGEAPPSLRADALPADAGYCTCRLESNMHTGTHIDAPMHVLADQRLISEYPVAHFYGRAALIDVRGLSQVMMRPEWTDIFRNYKVILFLTGHSACWGTAEYYAAFPEFEPDIARALVKAGVRIAGFDSPSPDREPYGFHAEFLQHGRFLVENLTGLEALLEKKQIDFMTLPLKINAEASLVRAVAFCENA
jgi:kynurenine formamidase